MISDQQIMWNAHWEVGSVESVIRKYLITELKGCQVKFYESPLTSRIGLIEMTAQENSR